MLQLQRSVEDLGRQLEGCQVAASGVSSWAQMLLVATILSSVFMGVVQILRTIHAYRLPRTPFPVERATNWVLHYLAAMMGEWARLLCPRAHREPDQEQEHGRDHPPLPSSSLLGVRVSSILLVYVVFSKISDLFTRCWQPWYKKKLLRIQV